MKKVFENNYIEIFDIRDDISNTIMVLWKDYLNKNKEVIEGIDKILEFIKEASIKVMISDHKNLKGVSNDVTKYILDYYLNHCTKLGLITELSLKSDYDTANITIQMIYSEKRLLNKRVDRDIYTYTVNDINKAKRMAKMIINQLD